MYSNSSGAPTLWIISREASFLGSKAGLLRIATIWAGTMTMWVTFSFSMSLITASGSNFSWRIYLAPRYIQGIRSSMAPLKTMAPECRHTLSGVMRQQPAKMVQYMART